MKLTSKEASTIKAYEFIDKARRVMKYHQLDYWSDYFDKLCQLLPSGRILDVGCGIGRDAPMFLGTGYQYVGVDLSASVAIAREITPKAELYQMNMYDLDFPDDSFDGFWSTVTLLHAPKNKVSVALQEIRRVVKPGGIGFISMQKGDGEKMVPSPDAPGHKRFFAFYGLNEFADVLTHNGFEVIEKDNPSDVKGSNPKSGDGWLTYFVRIRK